MLSRGPDGPYLPSLAAVYIFRYPAPVGAPDKSA